MPILPNGRRSSGAEGSNGGAAPGSKAGRLVADPDDDLVPLAIDLDLDRSGDAAVAVHDHVGHPLVDGLHEIADRGGVGAAAPGALANEATDVLQPADVGRDPEGACLGDQRDGPTSIRT